MEVPSDKFVFSEASYAEQFLGVLAGDQGALTNHFSKNTCLLIGLSLDDEMLRNLLVISSRSSPGNYHYFVYFLKKGRKIEPDQREAIERSNFNVYNLITLFLTEREIAALGDFINPKVINDEDFCDHARQTIKGGAFRFYLTGPLGVGKSTILNQFRNLIVYDEWLETKPRILAKPWWKLNPVEREKADCWIARQFKLKNDNLRRGKFGIFMVDRPPLDPLSFTPADAKSDKARRLLEAICPGMVDKVESGTVILLMGDPEEPAVRLILTEREGYTATKLKEMTSAFRNIYKGKGVVILDTHGLTIQEVTKKVAAIVHMEPYKPYNLHNRLEKCRDNKA